MKLLELTDQEITYRVVMHLRALDIADLYDGDDDVSDELHAQTESAFSIENIKKFLSEVHKVNQSYRGFDPRTFTKVYFDRDTTFLATLMVFIKTIERDLTESQLSNEILSAGEVLGWDVFGMSIVKANNVPASLVDMKQIADQILESRKTSKPISAANFQEITTIQIYFPRPFDIRDLHADEEELEDQNKQLYNLAILKMYNQTRKFVKLFDTYLDWQKDIKNAGIISKIEWLRGMKCKSVKFSEIGYSVNIEVEGNAIVYLSDIRMMALQCLQKANISLLDINIGRNIAHDPSSYRDISDLILK